MPYRHRGVGARTLGLVVLLGVLCPTGGCGLLFESTSEPLPTYWQPELLYLLPKPYDRLHVEVDVLQGVTVKPEWLAALRAFLARHCLKPGGVYVVRDDTIRAADVQGLWGEAVASLYMDGPPTDRAATTAYLYVLFYDSRQMGNGTSNQPCVTYLYPFAIYVDVAYNRFFLPRLAVTTLTHEAGHVLGLCKSTTHGDGAHCRNADCLMWPSLPLPWFWWLGVYPEPKTLCADCMNDLSASRRSKPDLRVNFRGPLVLRRQCDYRVLLGPTMVELIVHPGNTHRWPRFLRSARQWVRQRKIDPGEVYWSCNLGPLDSDPEIARVRAAIDAATRDPAEPVRTVAKLAMKQLQQRLARRARAPATSPD